MTPEEEWLQSSLRRDRERRMFRDMLEPDDRVRVRREHGKSNSFAWVCYALAVFLALAAVVGYYS